ncbi:hypothetical protein [Sphingomonas sp. 8AM]|uniref:hypothetical protein n=1 Tax=Sphingomonas sp. 8AM TaxID=2653170 RepID=UPI0013569966|nr:hypothetical protein [Sphingomonas sp. 8AM]
MKPLDRQVIVIREAGSGARLGTAKLAAGAGVTIPAMKAGTDVLTIMSLRRRAAAAE